MLSEPAAIRQLVDLNDNEVAATRIFELEIQLKPQNDGSRLVGSQNGPILEPDNFAALGSKII